MIQLEKPNKANVIGDVETTSFGISETDQGHVISILRDRLYSDKIAAPIREYGTNALDANREAGNDKAIKVTAPTMSAPTFSIRDYGSGISEDDMRNKYVQYGHSSKRESNLSIGQLGLGCKSGYAYTNTFRVVSYFDGEAKTYVCHLDDDNKGSISKIGTVPTTETGLEVLIDVKPQEVNAFQQKIRDVMQYFSPAPISNIDIPKVVYTEKGLHWGLRTSYYNSGPKAIMGSIAYPINPDIATTPGQSALLAMPIDIEFPIGAVEISASRESLEYKSLTKKTILNRLNAIENELTAEIKTKFDACKDTFSARKLWRDLNAKGSISSYIVNKTFCTWGTHDLSYSTFYSDTICDQWKKTEPDAKVYLHQSGARNIQRSTTKRNWTWQVTYNDVAIIHNDEAATTWTKRFATWRNSNYRQTAIIVTGTEENLQEYLLFNGLDGCPVVTLSTIAVSSSEIYLEDEGSGAIAIDYAESAEEVAKRAARLQKHKTKVFTLENPSLGKHPKSDNWSQAVIDLESDTGYYMLINSFTPMEANDLELLQLLVALEIDVGTVYGVKKDLKEKMGANWKPFSEFALEQLRTYIKASDKFDALKGQTLAAYSIIPVEADPDIETELPDPDIAKAVKAIRNSKEAYHKLNYSDQRLVTRLSNLLESLKLDINEDLELVKHVEARYFFLKAVNFFSGNGKMLCRSKEVLSELGEYIKMKQEQNNE